MNGGNRIDVSPNRERRGKRKGRAQDAKCVQAQPGGRWQQNRYRSNRERRGKRKGRAQDANCVQAQPGEWRR